MEPDGDMSSLNIPIRIGPVEFGVLGVWLVERKGEAPIGRTRSRRSKKWEATSATR